MNLEKERKFLVDEVPVHLLNSIPVKIKQGYLMLDKESGKQLRVRIINDEYAFIAYKFNVDIESKFEFEYNIPLLDAIKLYDNAICTITKIRYTETHNGLHIDVDVYNNNLIVAEIEYDEKELDLSIIPAYCKKEITGVKEYSNIYMALNNK